jgi:hypothetical protein
MVGGDGRLTRKGSYMGNTEGLDCGDDNSKVRGGVLEHVSVLKAVVYFVRRLCPHAVPVYRGMGMECRPDVGLDESQGGVLSGDKTNFISWMRS